MKLYRQLLVTQHLSKLRFSCARYSTSTCRYEFQIKNTRNIGIIAHIDAGKTTTTERMLYYSGLTRRIGDVDEGSTVTDFLPAERSRGITIQSAAVTFRWPPLNQATTSHDGHNACVSYTINLIDTPGHADFTFEVLRSLRILDGAVCILDGVAGVEAQTEKVWGQAQKFKIPRIVFVNKLDRVGAAFGRTVRQIGSRLRGYPAVCQIPWFEKETGKFRGIGDAVNLRALWWKGESDGKNIQSFDMKELLQEDPNFHGELIKARIALVESICDFDEQLFEEWLAVNDDSLSINAQSIWASIRRCLIDGSGRLVPVFAGASFRNIGIQPLLDAVNDLLPDPTERPDPEVSIENQKCGLSEILQGRLVPNFTKNIKSATMKTLSNSLVSKIEACALVFKVASDIRRGVLVYVRVYHGRRVLQMQASDAVEISCLDKGQIGVITGLKYARTGDTLIAYPNFNPKIGPPSPLNVVQLRPIDIPPPVFFAAIEPHSIGEEKNVAETLGLLIREDPSLNLSIDEDSGQMLLSGMGDLHLEIARDRLINEYKAKATMGNIEISYRESILHATPENHIVFDREIAGKKAKAACGAIIEPIVQLATDILQKTDNFTTIHNGNLITVKFLNSTSPEELNQKLPPDLSSSLVQSSLTNGVISALSRGPRRSYPLHNTHVTIIINVESDLFSKETTPAALASVARLAVQDALKESHSNGHIIILEPLMKVLISCDDTSLGAIVHDISAARGGHVVSLGTGINEEDAIELPPIDIKKIYVPKDNFTITDINDDTNNTGQRRQVIAMVPLKEMIGYLKHVHSLTAGRGTFIMNFHRFERLKGHRERVL
ncbi:BgTH12-04547 [Blumeria graminis f. sp. triticale]|uniref:Ribosome-releasing factor 2, mitochondrial n=1 Tax=Blumeria graminis f. sp. triticale TaxID=1689686 RepID=A0A9W4CUS9_BLUGR|nr:BgTH12-04547 [Blumeria graminis f. sp. triticale]